MGDDCYLLGHYLDMDKSVLSDIKQKEDSTVQLNCQLQEWCREGVALTELEAALIAIGRKDLISGK